MTERKDVEKDKEELEVPDNKAFPKDHISHERNRQAWSGIMRQMQSAQILSVNAKHSQKQIHKGSGSRKGNVGSHGAGIKTKRFFFQVSRSNKANANIKFSKVQLGGNSHKGIMESDPGSGADKSSSREASNSLQLDSRSLKFTGLEKEV